MRLPYVRLIQLLLKGAPPCSRKAVLKSAALGVKLAWAQQPLVWLIRLKVVQPLRAAPKVMSEYVPLKMGSYVW